MFVLEQIYGIFALKTSGLLLSIHL